MNFLSKFFKRKSVKNEAVQWDLNSGNLGFLNQLGIDSDNIDNSSDLSETIVFICLRHLSETMSKMPWERRRMTKQGKERDIDANLDYILNLRPNEYYSASTFWQTMEFNKLYYGNSFAYTEYDKKGILKHLWLLPSDQVEVWQDDKGIFGNTNALWYVWTNEATSEKFRFSSDEILHFKANSSFNALVGVSVLDILKTQISTGKSSIGFLNKLFKSNMFGSKMLVHYTGELSQAKEEYMAGKLEKFTAVNGSGKIIPMPIGMDAKMLDMKLADPQFFEHNKINNLQLAAAFGIKPNVINDYTKSSYSNSESQQIDFFVNTLQPLFNSYQQEISSKLLTPAQLRRGYRLDIDEKILFKMDSTTQADVLTKYVAGGILTPNEARVTIDYKHDPTGNTLMINGGAVPLDQVKNNGGGNE